MEKYILDEPVEFEGIRTGVSLDDSYEVLVEILTEEVRQTKSTVLFRMGKGGSVLAPPVAHEGVVYFGAADSNVYAADIETGLERWRFATQAQVFAGPILSEGVLYAGSYDGNLYALTIEGKLIWKFSAGDRIASIPACDNGKIVFGCKNNNIYCVSKKGKLLWKFATQGTIGGRVFIYKGIVYAGSYDKNVYAIELETGKEIWRTATGGGNGGPVVGGGRVYIGSFDKNLYCIDFKGRIIWKFPFNDSASIGTTGIYEKGTLYIGTRDQNMYAIRNGKMVWKFATGNMIVARAIIDGNDLIFGSADSNLYILDKRSGKEKWRFSAGGPVIFPEKRGDRIFFGSHDCNLYCISTKGKLLWKFHTSLDYPSDLEPETEVSHSIVIPSFRRDSEKQGEKKTEKDFGSYGDLKGNYIGEDMRDYIGKSMGEKSPLLKYKKRGTTYR